MELSPGDSSTDGYDVKPLHARPRSPAAGSASSALIQACSVPWRSMELRSEEHTSELQSLMRISYAVFCLKKKNNNTHNLHSLIRSSASHYSITTTQPHTTPHSTS